MANIYPASFLKPRTRGERQVIEFFKEKLDNSWTIFYEPLIVNSQPDLILFNEQYGIAVVEIKDYKLDTIAGVYSDHWILSINKRTIRVTSPFLQAKNYSYALIDYLATEDKLLVTSAVFLGKLKLPVVPLCIFVNLSKEDMRLAGINNVIPAGNIFNSEFSALNEKEISGILHSLFEKYFLIKPLTEIECNIIKSKLYPKLEVKEAQEKKDRVSLNYKNTKQIHINKEKSSSLQLFSFLTCIINDEEMIFVNPAELLFSINEFDSLVEELLFISTEIRHLYKNIQNDLSKVAVIYNENRKIYNEDLNNKILTVLSQMGVPVEVGQPQSKKVNILSVDQFNQDPNYHYIFLVDFNQVKRRESLNKILATIREASTGRFIYLSFNTMSVYTENIKRLWEELW